MTIGNCGVIKAIIDPAVGIYHELQSGIRILQLSKHAEPIISDAYQEKDIHEDMFIFPVCDVDKISFLLSAFEWISWKLKAYWYMYCKSDNQEN